MTIDQLAAAGGTSTRRVRSLQTLDLLPRPELHGRTGRYGPEHLARLEAIVRLQEQGFSLESLRVLFGALDNGESLASVLGLPSGPETRADDSDDAAALYGFGELDPPRRSPRHGHRRRPALFVVPTTVWDAGRAS